MRRIRSHLNYANVMATIAVFIAISGGTAVALNGSNTVQSDDLGPGSQVKAPDVAANAVGSPKVINESLTGQDIKNRSGVDTCPSPLTIKFGPICAGSDGVERTWDGALGFCGSLRLRLPSTSEAITLARNHDVPGVAPGHDFWTDEFFVDNRDSAAVTYSEDGNRSGLLISFDAETVCVTDPSA
jgi:hypothetical protein